MTTCLRLAVLFALLMPARSAAQTQTEPQSLSDVARAEQQRRSAVVQPSKVYTNADLPAVEPGTRPVPAPVVPPEAASSIQGERSLASSVLAIENDERRTLWERITTMTPDSDQPTVEWSVTPVYRADHQWSAIAIHQDVDRAACELGAVKVSQAVLHEWSMASDSLASRNQASLASSSRSSDGRATIRLSYGYGGVQRQLDWLCLPSTTVARDADGHIARSEAAKRAFWRATGFPNGRPGWVVDHVKPLACAGADDMSNMQWQTIDEARTKDRTELDCRQYP